MTGMMQYLSELIHAQLENKKPRNIPTDIQVDDLVEIAHKNHMDYMILKALLKTNLTDDKKMELKPYIIQSTLRAITQISCLKEFEDKCEKEGIFHQVLKGSVLKSIYTSSEMRDMSDIDVMIYDENLDRAKKVVEEMGFNLYKSIKHHDIYMKPPLLIIELHHALYDKDVDKNQYDYFKNQKNLIVKEGRKHALQFDVEDFYIYMTAHMAKHFYETGCGIRNILDVYIYRQTYEATWDNAIIERELEKCRLTAFENKIHKLSKVWLGELESDPFSEMLFNYMTDCGIYGKGENGVWGKFALHSHINSKNYKSYAKRWYYFPPKSYMECDYPWLKKTPYLLVVAWGIRAVHGLLSKEGREKRKMLSNIKSEEVCAVNEIYKGMQLHFKKD